MLGIEKMCHGCTSHLPCPGHPMCDGTGKPFLGWWDDDATCMQDVSLSQARVPALTTPGLQKHTGSYRYVDSSSKTLSCIFIHIHRSLLVYTYISIEYHNKLPYNHVDFGFVFMPCLDIILPKEPAGPRQDDTQKARLGMTGGVPIYGISGYLELLCSWENPCFWMTCPLVIQHSY